MNSFMIAGIAGTLIAMVGLSIWSGRHQKSKSGGNSFYVAAWLINNNLFNLFILLLVPFVPLLKKPVVCIIIKMFIR